MMQYSVVLFTRLPRLMRLGLIVLAIGGGLDLFYHAALPGWTLWMDTYLGPDGMGAHLVTLIGMIVTLLGLFIHHMKPHRTSEEVIPPEGRPSIEH